MTFIDIYSHLENDLFLRKINLIFVFKETEEEAKIPFSYLISYAGRNFV